MSVTEIKQAVGGWELRLREDTPQQVLNALTFYGHIAILPGELPVAQYGDALLASARYVGVYRGRDAQNEFTLKGSGMAFWLGDEDEKGDVLETPVVLTAATFANSIRALLPPGGAITEGTLYSVPGTLSQTFQWQTPRKAITYVADTFGAEFRVNYLGTLDAGLVSQLYVTTPKAILMRRSVGVDLSRRALPGRMAMGVDVEDTTTRVVLLAEGEGNNIATGDADAPPTPYRDIHGNPLKVTRLVSESGTEADNAAARAQLQLNRFLNPRRSVSLSSNEYDVKGTFVVGDYIDVYDPENGFYDAAREVAWQADRINPMALRCVEMSWPIPPGWTVAFRDIDGNWIDLSRYYVGESGDTTIVVGELSRGLASVGGEPLGVRPNLPESASPASDITIPAAPAFTGFSSGAYESDDRTLAAIMAEWAQPLNTDASTIIDGAFYQLRYRPNAIIGTKVPWDLLAGGYSTDLDFAFTPSSGVSWPGGWSIRWGDPANFSSGAGIANVHHTPTNWLVSQTYGVAYQDAEIVANFRITDTPVGASFVHGISFRRDSTTGTGYHLSVEPNVGGTVTTKLRGHNGTSLFEMSEKIIPGMVHDPTRDYWMRVNFNGGEISWKIWQGEESDQPERDTSSYYHSSPYTGGTTSRPGIWGYLVGGNTNPLPVTISTTTFKVRRLTSDNVANAYSWDDLGSWDAVTSEPVSVTPNWSVATAGWDQTAYTLTELSPGVTYEFQIRAVDSASPPHFSAWSASSFVSTTGDVIAPSTPAAPEVASSMIAVQLVHRLGKASGGAFNLEQDIAKLEVHASSGPNFNPEDATKVGDLLANGAMVRAGIPAVGTFKVDQPGEVWIRVVSVDRTGNRSSPSEAVQSTVTLIDDAHISDLTVSKVTAGTITAEWLMAGAIRTAQTGARVEMTSAGLNAYNPAGTKTVEIKSSDGSATFTGKLQTMVDGSGVSFENFGGNVFGFWSINDGSGVPLSHRVKQLAWDQGGTFGQTFLESIIRTSDGAQDGGKLMLTEFATILSHQPDVGNETYLSLGGFPGGGIGRIYMRGKFERAWVQDSNGAIYTTQQQTLAGFSGQVHAYGYTMPDFMCPTIMMTGTIGEDFLITIVSATGFTFSWSGTATHRVFVWCPRVESS